MAQDDKEMAVQYNRLTEIRNKSCKSIGDSREDEFSIVIMATITKMKRIIQSKNFHFIDANRFSKWTRLLKITLWALKFIKLCLKGKIPWLQSISPDKDSMTKPNYDKEEWILIKQAQSDEINEQQISTWNLYYDKTDNLWRSKSRFENADLDMESKFPIYLPNRNHITKLITKHKHEELYHAGIGHTLCELRQKFWIPSGRSAVKRIINECIACKRWKAKPFKLPLMPNLPEFRIKKSRIFEQVGLDYLGPHSIKNDTGIVKRTIMDQNKYFITSKGMIWKNIIPKAPWSGGVYERMIGLPKGALKRAMGRKLLWEREFVTLTVEIEGILNTRPLTCLNFDDYKIMRSIDFTTPYVSLDIPTNEDSTQDEFTLHPLNTKEKLVNYWSNTLKALDECNGANPQWKTPQTTNQFTLPLEVKEEDSEEVRTTTTKDKPKEEPITLRTRGAQK
uniref:Integrase_H2C2 domain-containing protein n=1 Tax=Loa loa TaxID=7209 RepID=A0A1I7W0I4_LOALO